jgi:hypothetical protein
VVQAGGREWFCEEFLAAERRVAAAALVGVAADVAVAVADVVEVFRFELFCGAGLSVCSRCVVAVSLYLWGLTVGDQFEGFPPEDDALLHVQSNAFQEERVLQSALVLQMAVLAQLAMQVLHAEGKVRAQTINAAGVNVGDVADAAVLVVRRIRRNE